MPDPTGGTINRGPEVTFGCGAFLPGRGPFNFDDFTGFSQGAIDAPEGPTDFGGGISIDPADGPIDSKPPGGNPTWPNDIDIPFNDPTGGWVDDQWPPTQGWDPKWEIIDIEILTENGAVPTTAGGLPYIPVVNSETGILSLPSIRTPTWGNNNPPKIIIIKLKYPAIPGGVFEPSEYTFTTTVTSTDLGGIVIVDGGIVGTEATGQIIDTDTGLAGGGTQADPTYGGTVTPPRTEYNEIIPYEISQKQNPGRITTIAPMSWQPGTEIIFVNVISAGNATPVPIINPPGTLFVNTLTNFNSVQYLSPGGNTEVYNASLFQGGGMWGQPGARKVRWNSDTGVFKLFSIDTTFLTAGNLGKPIGLEIVTRHPDFELASDGSINIPDQVWLVKLIVKDGGSPDDLGEDEPDTDPNQLVAGGGIERQTLLLPSRSNSMGGGIIPKGNTDTSMEGLISTASTNNKIDLNDPTVKSVIRKNNPTGIMDADIAYEIDPSKTKMIPNDTGSSDLFGPRIDENVSYIVKNNEFVKDWDATKPRGVTERAILRSLTPEARRYLSRIKNYDGTPINTSQRFAMIGSRILDGTLGNINVELLRKFAEASDSLEDFEIIRSNSERINEVAALAYIERNYKSLDPAQSEGTGRLILPNWKVFATDVDKHIEIRLSNGTLQKFYVKDDNTLVDRSNIKVQDGDFVEVKVGGVLKRFFCKSEIDHAFLMPEKVKMKAINLLGGDSARTLSVSADASSGIEFDYSLTAPRQNFYVMSAVLSSTVTQPTDQGSYVLKDTKITYELMDTSSTSGLEAVNEYIRYKANFRAYTIDDDDRMLDYIETTGKLHVQQTDILLDAPKTTKTTPLLVRQIPWYIIVYPTNRPDYNIFNSKSSILTYDASGSVSRTLRTAPTTTPEFNQSNLNIFAPQVLVSTNYPNAVGEYSTQTRIAEITGDEKVYQTGYRKSNVELGSAQTVNPPKLKTTFRVIKEIITELNDNFILEWGPMGRSLTTFDVISRLNLKEFSKFISIENYALLFPLVKKGIINDVKVFEPTAFSSGRLTDKKTQLVQRRSTAGEDTFVPIKSMATGYKISSPTTAGPEFSPIERQPVTPT